MIEGIRRFGRIEPGAAMGVTFTAMFAAGVLLLEQSDTSGVHLDVEHALFGNLESLIWLDATGWASLLDPAALAGLPPELFRIALVAALMALGLLSDLLATACDFDLRRRLCRNPWACRSAPSALALSSLLPSPPSRPSMRWARSS